VAKSIEDSVKMLRGVSQALLAAKEVYVKDKDEKDDVTNRAFRIIKRELEYLEENAE
jgi:hypothetical protein